ncbi:hypothetical protein DRF67_19820 [Chryseobacterium pennipullorum]|uniref:Uncharacterized protein n=1 Tax=Chryseobacterium pennipullorum TaxID=2258963 RepID=A0A3D9AQ43_9FLAO|nr:hypothetical protein DRF67_19820 [Chryseobacterium pennipullorum]
MAPASWVGYRPQISTEFYFFHIIFIADVAFRIKKNMKNNPIRFQHTEVYFIEPEKNFNFFDFFEYNIMYS